MRPSLVLVLAYAVDLVLGEPPNALHPVAWMGSIIERGKAWALTGTRGAQLAKGAVLASVVPSACALAAFAALRTTRLFPVVETVIAIALLKSSFSARGLRNAAFAVRDALEGGDLAAARLALGSLCSRKADALEPDELVAATIESVAENTSDSVVAPLFFFACGGVPAGIFYRAVNTLDAMVGYRGRLEYAGKASARLDDLLNLIPARATAALLLIAGIPRGASVAGGLRVLVRDRRRTESPNAGWPMATMAGLLGVRLTKADHYVLGDAVRPLAPSHITAAWRITSLASALTVVLLAIVLEGLR